MFELVEGDVFEEIRDLPDDSAEAAIIDYPWEFDIENGSGRYNIDDGGIYQREELERLPEVLYQVSRVLVDGGWVFVFSDDDFYPNMRDIVVGSPLTYRRTAVWDRVHFGQSYYHRVQHYPMITATNGETERYIQDRGTVYRAEAPSNQNSRATEKPVELYRQMMESPVLEDGETLIEPFCGTAPGAYAARERDLNYWGCDIDSVAFETREKQTGAKSLLDR